MKVGDFLIRWVSIHFSGFWANQNVRISSYVTPLPFSDALFAGNLKVTPCRLRRTACSLHYAIMILLPTPHARSCNGWVRAWPDNSSFRLPDNRTSSWVSICVRLSRLIIMLHREVGKQEWKVTFELYFQMLAVLCNISHTRTHFIQAQIFMTKPSDHRYTTKQQKVFVLHCIKFIRNKKSTGSKTCKFNWGCIIHHVTSHHVTSRHATSHHITSHHITSHHVTSRNVTSHHITIKLMMSRFWAK